MATREETAEMIKVMQHYVDGGDVEFRSELVETWTIACAPTWRFNDAVYRIKQPKCECPTWVMDMLDAQAVFDWVAIDQNGLVYMYSYEPFICHINIGFIAVGRHAHILTIYDMSNINWSNAKYKRGSRNAV